MNFNRKTLVTITAPTCSGKNYLRDILETRPGFEFTRIVSTTTRAPRTGEEQGIDYDFITDEKSREMEANGEFAELIEFRGVRYGVTNTEMELKMNSHSVPVIILEPQGLAIYKKMCAEHDWGVYTIYIHTPEETRLDRLTRRTADGIKGFATTLCDMMLEEQAKTQDGMRMTYSLPSAQFEKAIEIHTDRVKSILTDERRWSQTNIWDCIIPGDDLSKALKMIEAGVKHRNNQTSAPRVSVTP